MEREALLELESQLEATAQRVPELIALLEADKAVIDAQIKRLRSFHRAYVPEDEQPKARRRNGGGGAYKRSKKSLATVAAAILANTLANEEFTSSDAYNWTGISKKNTTVYTALGYLRSIEAIAALGKRRGAQGQPANYYRALDRELLERVVQENGDVAA